MSEMRNIENMSIHKKKSEKKEIKNQPFPNWAK